MYTDTIIPNSTSTQHLASIKDAKNSLTMKGEPNNNDTHYKSALHSNFSESLTNHHNHTTTTTTLLLTMSNDDSSLMKDKNGAAALFQRMKAISNRFYIEHKEVSAFQQFYILFRVMMLRMIRARIPIIIQLLHHSLVGLCIG